MKRVSSIFFLFLISIWVLGIFSIYLPYKPNTYISKNSYQNFKKTFLRGKFFSSDRISHKELIFYRTKNKTKNWSAFVNPEFQDFKLYKESYSIQSLKRNRLQRFFKSNLPVSKNEFLMNQFILLNKIESDSVELIIVSLSKTDSNLLFYKKQLVP